MASINILINMVTFITTIITIIKKCSSPLSFSEMEDRSQGAKKESSNHSNILKTKMRCMHVNTKIQDDIL